MYLYADAMPDDDHDEKRDEDAELAASRAEAIGEPVIVAGFENAESVTVLDVNANYEAELAAWQELAQAQMTPERFFSLEELNALAEPGGPWAREPSTVAQRTTWRESHPALVERYDAPGRGGMPRRRRARAARRQRSAPVVASETRVR